MAAAVGLPLAGAAFGAQPGGAGASERAPANIHGTVQPGFEGVRAAFEENFSSGKDLGATFAVYRDGVPLVDLWGGSANKDGTVPVSDRTIFALHSATKGLSAICIAMLVDRGKLDYEAPVAAYWPEFAANGKAAITVGQLMSHQAGLTGPRTPVTTDDYFAHDAVAAMLAAQEPFFRPGVWGYHAYTIGTLADELVRRTDGRTIRRFYTEEVKAKLQLDAFMGLSSEELYRVAEEVPALDPINTRFYDSPNPAALAASSPVSAMKRDWSIATQHRERQHGLASGGGTANARSLAKLYGFLVSADQPGASPLMKKSVLQQATRDRVSGPDQCSGGIGRYAAGFRLNIGTMGSNPAAFGHPGFGGAMAFADPTRRLGIAYTTNRVLNPTWQWVDPRLAVLLSALYAVKTI